MPDFIASFEGRYYYGNRTIRFFGYSKEQAIRQAKRMADEQGADEIHIEYKGSGKSVGFWEKRGSRWYKE